MEPATPDRRIRIAALIAGGVTLVVLLLHVARVVKMLGHWTYAVDDAYIHLAVARSVHDHGVWGLSPHDPAGASSSPLWTLLCALFGAPNLLPLVLNVALATAFAAAVAGRSAARSGSWAVGAAFGVGGALALPLVPAVASGMEHLLHGALAGLLLVESLRERPRPPLVGLLAALALFCRPETAFVLAIAGALLLLGRHWRGLGALALGTLVAALAYWLVARAFGISVVPNSVALKAMEVSGASPVGKLQLALENMPALRWLLYALAIPALALAAEALARRVRSLECPWNRDALATGAALALVVAHVLFARVGYVGRYEVYLYVVAGGLGLPALASAVRGAASGQTARAVAASLGLALFLTLRFPAPLGFLRQSETSARWSAELDANQREIARFLDEALPGGTVVMNDVGATSYFPRRVRILDAWGLGNNEACAERLRVGGVPGPEWLDGFASRNRADAAVVFESWFDGRAYARLRSPGRGLPKGWTKIGEFRLTDGSPLILGAPAASVFAVRPADAERLRAALAAFRPRSPLAAVAVQPAQRVQ